MLSITGCANSSLEDFQEEGEAAIYSLVQELKLIQTREQLLAASGTLQKDFDRLVSIIVKTQEWVNVHPESVTEAIQVNHELSDALRVELNRLYHLEGGRQMIEKCQEKALQHLDAFYQRNLKKTTNKL